MLRELYQFVIMFTIHKQFYLLLYKYQSSQFVLFLFSNPNSSAFSTIFKANCACLRDLNARLRERMVPKLNAAFRSKGES